MGTLIITVIMGKQINNRIKLIRIILPIIAHNSDTKYMFNNNIVYIHNKYINIKMLNSNPNSLQT